MGLSRRPKTIEAQYAVTIAVGMAVTGALVSLMLAVAYQPLPFPQADRIVQFWQSGPTRSTLAMSDPDISEFALGASAAFSSLGGFSPDRLWLHDRLGATQTRFDYLLPDTFRALNVAPILGRGFRPDDSPVNADGVLPAWLSFEFWQSRYGGSPSVLGTEFGLAFRATGPDKRRLRVMGVLPARANIPIGFSGGIDAADFWCAWPHSADRHSFGEFGMGRLRPGVSLAAARAALQTVAARLGQTYAFDQHKQIVAADLQAIAQGPARQTMGLVGLAVGLALLVALLNLAVMMVTQGLSMRTEMAIRTALGATRRRLWLEISLQKGSITLLAVGLGWVLAAIFLRVLSRLLPAAGLGPALPQAPTLNQPVLIGFATSAVAGAMVWSALSVHAASGCNAATRSINAAAKAAGGGGRRWRAFLLFAQAAIGICLLVAAAAAVYGYHQLSQAGLGPAPDRTLVVDVKPAAELSQTQGTAFNQMVLARMARLPGIASVALTTFFPPDIRPGHFRKQEDPPDTDRLTTPLDNRVSVDYFRTLGIAVLFGRGFDARDSQLSAEPVVVIDLAMAQQNWATPRQAIGSEIVFGPDDAEPFRVVGVVGNFTGYWSQTPAPIVYLPGAESHTIGANVIVRATHSSELSEELVRNALAPMVTPIQINDARTLQASWDATLTRPRARMTVMVLLALLGLGLSMQGVHAVAAAAIEASRHDLAIHKSLGASAPRLVWLVVDEVLAALAAGATVGVIASFTLQPLLRQWLGPTAVWKAAPPLTAFVFLAIAVAWACYTPAREAIVLDPAEILCRS